MRTLGGSRQRVRVTRDVGPRPSQLATRPGSNEISTTRASRLLRDPPWERRPGSWARPPEELPRALDAVDRQLATLDQQASRFREDSEISRVNSSESHTVLLSDGLAELLRE